MGLGGGEEGFVVLRGEPTSSGLGVEKDEGADAGGLEAEGFDEREELGFEEEDFGTGVVEDELELFGGEADVEGQQDGAGLEYAVIGFEEPMAVGAEEGHAIAGLDAEGYSRLPPRRAARSANWR